MNVASLELSNELYELSKWRNTEYWWRLHKPNGLSKLYTFHEMDADRFRFRNSPEAHRFSEENDFFPAYDLGCLLRKLPDNGLARRLTIARDSNGTWVACFHDTNSCDDFDRSHGDTPEDAVTKLAIELFKQGILTKEVT